MNKPTRRPVRSGPAARRSLSVLTASAALACLAGPAARRSLSVLTASAALACLAGLVAPSARAQAPEPRFDVVVLGETGSEIHAPMVAAAKVWLNQLAKDSNFTVTYVENPTQFTDTYLGKFELILQLNYTPWRWSATAKAAFEKYIEEGRGGWVGCHHALLFGAQFLPQGEPLWTWYFKFMGEINYKNYIASFAEATVRVEATDHPVFKGVPASFNVAKEEWYTFDKSPRPKVKVLANVDESTYQPNSSIKMGGDHPVVWTNEAALYKGRNLFLFMGHHPDHYKNTAYTTLMRNAIFWAASKTTPTGLAGKPGRNAAGASSRSLVLGTRFPMGSSSAGAWVQADGRLVSR